MDEENNSNNGVLSGVICFSNCQDNLNVYGFSLDLSNFLSYFSFYLIIIVVIITETTSFDKSFSFLKCWQVVNKFYGQTCLNPCNTTFDPFLQMLFPKWLQFSEIRITWWLIKQNLSTFEMFWENTHIRFYVFERVVVSVQDFLIAVQNHDLLLIHAPKNFYIQYCLVKTCSRPKTVLFFNILATSKSIYWGISKFWLTFESS